MKTILLLIFILSAEHAISQNEILLKLRSECKDDTCLITKIHRYYKNVRYSNNDSASWAVNEELKFSKKSGNKKYILIAWMDAVDLYAFRQEYQLAVVYSDSAYILANELNDKISLCHLYNLTGIIYSDQSDYEKSIEIYNKELTLAKSINFRSGISQAYSNIGVSYYYMADYGKAIDFYLKALKLLEEDRDTSRISTTLSNLAVFYQSKKQYNKALEMLQKALIYCNKNDLSMQSSTLNNISVTYNYMNDFEKALDFAKKTIELQNQMRDKKGLAASYNNLCGLYSKLEKHELAIENIKKALELSEEINIPIEVSHYNRTLSICYFNQKNYKLALVFALKSTAIAREQKIRKTIADNYCLLADIYRGMNEFKKSADYLFKYRDLNDSLVAEEFEKNIAEMDAKYQSQKKQKEIQLLTKDKKIKDAEFRQQTTQRNALIAGLILVLLLIIVVAKSYFQKKKDNKLLVLSNEEILQQKEEIEAQRDEIGIQRDLVVKQKEHIEEIHLEVSQSIDYATRIQTSILSDLSILKIDLSDYFVFFKPKDKVSGDFYWCAQVEGHTIITVADCTGHGVPGAFMSMLGISFLREIVVKEYITNPALILKKLRKEIIQALKQKGESGEQKDGMDMALVSISHESLEMQFAGANNPVYVIANMQPVIAMAQPEAISTAQSDCSVPRNDEYNFVDPVIELVEIKGDKMPIAIYERMDTFTNHIIQLNKGDCIYLMSDGYEDQFGGAKNKKFKSKNLKDLLMANSQQPMADQKEIIEKAFDDWKGENEQVDDVTILGIII